MLSPVFTIEFLKEEQPNSNNTAKHAVPSIFILPCICIVNLIWEFTTRIHRVCKDIEPHTRHKFKGRISASFILLRRPCPVGNTYFPENIASSGLCRYNFRLPFRHSLSAVSAMKEKKSELLDIASNTSIPFFSCFGKRYVAAAKRTPTLS